MVEQTFELEYRRAHYAQKDNVRVCGVTLLRSGMVATGREVVEVTGDGEGLGAGCKVEGCKIIRQYAYAVICLSM